MKQFERGNSYLFKHAATIMRLKILQTRDQIFISVVIAYILFSIIYALGDTHIYVLTPISDLLSRVPVARAFAKSNSDMKCVSNYLAGMLVSTPVLSTILYKTNIKHAKLAYDFSNVKLLFFSIGAFLIGSVIILSSLFITDDFESAPTKTRIIYKLFGTGREGVGFIYGSIFLAASFFFGISFKYIYELRPILTKR